jgi:aryl-alcohol dehydrogenase-like predicted oxidoreductase
VEHRELGASGLSVSVLALGSWLTWERIPRSDAIATLVAAREAGIDFLDTARYHDAAGQSEVVFGEILRASGWPRDEVTIANKLWWEFWPEQTVTEEVDASLGRTGLDHFDLIYSDPPPNELAMYEVVNAVTNLLWAGKARAWAVVNWPAEWIAEARELASPEPCAAQLPYNLVQRSPVEDEDMIEALGPMGVVASFVLAGGALTGKYPGATGRLSREIDNPRYAAALQEAERLKASGIDPTAAAIEFAVRAPRVATVLVGATSPAQVRDLAIHV